MFINNVVAMNMMSKILHTEKKYLKCIQRRIKTFQNNRRICLQEIYLLEKNQKGFHFKEHFNVDRESRWSVFMTT